MTRTFIDAGVLIQAARGETEIAERALAILQDENREFASSIFLKMEVLPKAVFHQNDDEIEFYNIFFDGVEYWATDLEQIVKKAYTECSKYGLGAMDALHVAAALSVNATELITNEKPTKSIHRTQSISLISIFS